MTLPGRRHDRALLDALEEMSVEAFSGTTWRVTSQGRDPLRGSSAGGRWSPAGEFEVLYTSLAATGAMAEIGYRLSLEPVWPSRIQHELHRISVVTKQTLRFTTLNVLQSFGVDIARYTLFDYDTTQAIAAAANFLGYDGLIVPSARGSELNLVLLTERLEIGRSLIVEETFPVNWEEWRTVTKSGR